MVSCCSEVSTGLEGEAGLLLPCDILIIADGAVLTHIYTREIKCKMIICYASAWLQRKLCSSGLQSQPAATHALVELLAARALAAKNKLRVNQRAHPGMPINVTEARVWG